MKAWYFVILAVLLFTAALRAGESPTGLIGKFETAEATLDNRSRETWGIGHGLEFRPAGVLIVHTFFNPAHKPYMFRKQPNHLTQRFHYSISDAQTMILTDGHGTDWPSSFTLTPTAILISGRDNPFGEPHWYHRVTKFRFEH